MPTDPAAATASSRDGLVAHVGSYTDAGRPAGLHALRIDPDAGTLVPLGATDVGPNPSYLAPHPTLPLLYAANELAEWAGAATGAVTVVALGEDGGPSRVLGRRASGGAAPCHLAVDPTGRHLVVANYVGGSVARLPIAADGTLGEATAVVAHEGRGPDATRQDAPHVHCALPDAEGRFALAADLGTDRVVVYALGADGTLARRAEVAAAPGAGPRHVALHPGRRTAYVVNELDLTLAAYAWDARDGTLDPTGAVALLDRRPPGEVTAAALKLARDGRFAYVSVRGADAVVVLALDDPRSPRVVQRVPCGGRWPRDLALDPSGRWLLVANQRSNDVVAFRVDADTGLLAPTGARVEVESPTCVTFVG